MRRPLPLVFLPCLLFPLRVLCTLRVQLALTDRHPRAFVHSCSASLACVFFCQSYPAPRTIPLVKSPPPPGHSYTPPVPLARSGLDRRESIEVDSLRSSTTFFFH